LEESPLQVFEVDKLVSGSGHQVTRILSFRKIGIHFCGMRATNVSNVQGMLPARCRDFLARRSLGFAEP
jgi:hypothetical protein